MLGDFYSAASFYMPVYDLYGKTLNVETGKRTGEAIRMVKSGIADVGAAPMLDSLKTENPDLKVFYISRDIPSSGVYLSPNLSTSDRETIKQTLLKAPNEIKKKSNYREGNEDDYTQFKQIIQRVDKILICADFSKNPVYLFLSIRFSTSGVYW